MCLQPLILAAYLLTTHFYGSHVTNLDAGALEVQTCERGLGLDAKASTSGLYGLALQYGLSTTLHGWTLTVTPKAGFAYVDHRMTELSSPGNFQLAGQVLVGRDRWRVGAEYWHISNAFLGDQNEGLDLILLQGGWIF